MPRQRGKDAKQKTGGGTKPTPSESDKMRSKRLRQPRSKAEMQRQRDPDAVDHNTIKSK